MDLTDALAQGQPPLLGKHNVTLFKGAGLHKGGVAVSSRSVFDIDRYGVLSIGFEHHANLVYTFKCFSRIYK